MKIALVDDDAKFLAQTARLVKLFLEDRGVTAEVMTFASAEDLPESALRRLKPVRPSGLMLKGADGIVCVALRDLVLVETAGHHVIVHVADGQTLIVRQSLKDIWDKLKENACFSRIGRQSIVSLAHVSRFAGNRLTLAGGRTVSVSRRSLVEFKTAFADFYGA